MTAKQIVARMKQASVPAMQLVAGHRKGSLSRIGGIPDVPRGFEWPTWKRKALAFLAQIDLGALPGASSLVDLPRGGMLYFFYDQEQSTWGFDPADRGSWRVIYLPLAEDLVQASCPRSLPAEHIYSPKCVSVRQIRSFPTSQRLGIHYGDVPDNAFNLVVKLRSEEMRGEPEHQIGGFPNPLQSDTMELECQLVSNGIYYGDLSSLHDPRVPRLKEGAKDWRLLFQLDSDDDAGMMWGDGGRLYFWIRTSELAERDFSGVWMVLHC